MQDVRTPEVGEIQIVTLLGENTFIGWASAADIDGLLDSFERVASIGPAERSDEAAHASIRMQTARILRGKDSERAWTQTLSAASLWLALRHWSRGDEMRRGLAKQMEANGRAVITASIADPVREGTMPDTAWAFMVGSKVHDGRKELAGQASGIVRVIGKDFGS